MQFPTTVSESTDAAAPVRIGVVPGHRVGDGLLLALEQAFPVRFEGVDRSVAQQLESVLVCDPSHLSLAPTDIPRLVLASPREDNRREHQPLALADDTRVQRPLRGRSLREDARAAELPLRPPAASAVLASVDGTPVWWQAGSAGTYVGASAYPLPVTVEGPVSLRDQMRPGCFMGLLPLLHLLEATLGERGFERSPLQASFVIDDPNLHRPSYGFLDYDEIAAHARAHGYHVGLAMVPLDGWLASRRAVSVFERSPGELSLVMHGNDHRKHELARAADERAATAIVAQALRRTAAFERRFGLPVQRVMVPPHEVCSSAALRAMFVLGMDGACIGRRYPWHAGLVPTPPSSLATWHPTDMVAGGLPVLPRHAISQAPDDLAFRALLRQPLILYGHHGDLADGPDVLADAARYVNSLGEVQWGPLGRIAERGVLVRRSAATLIVQMHARRCSVQIPPGVDALEVRTPASCDPGATRLLARGGEPAPMRRDRLGWTSGAFAVRPGAQLTLRLMPCDRHDLSAVCAPRSSAWALARRALVEGRDRLQPLARGTAARARAAIPLSGRRQPDSPGRGRASDVAPAPASQRR